MQDPHRQEAAEIHNLAAHAHSAGAEHHGKEDHQTGQEHSRHALEHAQKVFQQTQQAQRESATFGHKEISALAYEIWEGRGCPDGSAEEDWAAAVKQLRRHAVHARTKEKSDAQDD